MSRRARRTAAVAVSPVAGRTVFHPADVLYALEWAAVAPGLGGWNLILDNDLTTRLVSVVPPGAENPTFFITRDGEQVTITWLRQQEVGARPVDVGHFKSLREAVRSLCALSDDQLEIVNESMEVLYPRALRDR